MKIQTFSQIHQESSAPGTKGKRRTRKRLYRHSPHPQSTHQVRCVNSTTSPGEISPRRGTPKLTGLVYHAWSVFQERDKTRTRRHSNTFLHYRQATQQRERLAIVRAWQPPSPLCGHPHGDTMSFHLPSAVNDLMHHGFACQPVPAPHTVRCCNTTCKARNDTTDYLLLETNSHIHAI